MGLFRIGEESEATFYAFFDFTYRGDYCILISNNLSIKKLCNLSNFKLHS